MDKLLSLKETEHLLNVSKSTLQRWDNSGKLIALRTKGGHRRYKQSDIERLIGENKNEDAKQEQRKIERKEREIKTMKVELKQIIDELTDAINLPKGQKVAALIDSDKIVCWTIVDVHEDGSINPISDKKFTNLKELIEKYHE